MAAGLQPPPPSIEIKTDFVEAMIFYILHDLPFIQNLNWLMTCTLQFWKIKN